MVSPELVPGTCVPGTWHRLTPTVRKKIMDVAQATV